MSSVDERIVAMKFNNSQFEKGVAETTKSMDSLKKSLNTDAAQKGLSALSSVASKFSLQGLATGVQEIASRFSALSVIGVTAISNIANKAVNAGMEIAKSLTIDPIKAGFDEYELKMGSIQTILSNTARYGTTLGEVTSRLDELNTYADKTIYNFGDMTKNIGLFTNAGIRIEDATSMIKGFSNEAASSGTNAQGAASAAYQLSQALSAGTIRLMDWRSLQNVGMGNKNMQNGLIEIADAMGTLEANTTSAEEVSKNFNGSLEKNWLSADVMSTYLKIMAGDMTAAEQAQLGLTDAQVAAFAKQQKMSEDAATKVRTFSQLMGTLQESVGSGWASTFDILIGDFDQATDLWTAVNDELGSMIGKQSEARNELLKSFVKMGGRDQIITALGDIWKAFKMFVLPIKSAFKEIFPPVTAMNLMAIAGAFGMFAKQLAPSAETMALLKRTFLGVFAVLDIGWMVIKEVVGLFGRLFGIVGQGSTGFLEVTASIGDFLVRVRDAIKNGEGLGNVFKFIGDVVSNVVGVISGLAGAVGTSMGGVKSFADIWQGIADALKAVWEFLKPVGEWFAGVFGEIKNAVSGAFKAMDPNILLGALNVGLLGGAILIMKKVIDVIKKGFNIDIGGGFINSIKEMFGTLTSTMETMQAKLKAETLKQIAIAIAILAAAILVLSFIDPAKLATSLGAIAVGLGELMGAMAVMDKFITTGGAKLAFLAGALILLSTAMLIFSAAVTVMAGLSWEQLAKGMVGMGVGLAILLGSAKFMDAKASGKMILAGIGIIALATAMRIFASAVAAFADISWEGLGKGMAAMAASLVIMNGFASAVGKNAGKLAIGSIGVILISSAMLVLAQAVEKFGAMDMETIGKGLLALGGSLAIIGIAMAALPASVLASGAALLIVSLALLSIVDVLKEMGNMSWEEIGKSMVVLAGSLAILAGAMALMGIPLVMAGSVGIIAASFALMMLAPALILLGSMSWDEIGRGLAVLASALGILALGGVLLLPAIPAFLGLGAAILLLGIGTLAAGLGITMLAAGIIALAGAGAVGAEALKMAVMTMIGLIPMAMAAFAQGIIDFALVIAGGATEFIAAMTTLLLSLITAIGNVAPQIIETLWGLIVLLVDKIVKGVPLFVDAGMKILIGFINGIGNNIYRLATAATKVITEFVRALGDNSTKIVTAAGNAVLKFVNGLGDYVQNNSWRFVAAGSKLFRAVVDGISMAIEQGGADIAYAGGRIGNALLEGAKNALGINSPSKEFRDDIMPSVFEGIEDGESRNIKRSAAVGTNIGDSMIYAVKKSIDHIRDSVATDMDFTPTIKPVLDLSNVQKGAGTIGGLITPKTLKLDGAIAQANMTAVEVKKTTEPENEFPFDDDDGPTGDTYNFYQTNNSPQALSNGEIYRQTRNQISMAKTNILTKGAPS